ncbi:MAG: SUF system Fe-S cluster assembly protein [Arenicellales bacterium]|jgi:FeS assembly SUF system protein|nr:SUF system Fe-S cluster assembly protein [Arenicellales bacterium]MDP6854148.1 SUF system Fe-S cluster assembly protein [Arenicellales bacterium]MDP6947909.1 SUF system Fe-S cluster assembly protein [Arenicellales bacterium]|tara:strand:- start:3639 stop:4073 length:435 start_codon:yes stop_codon:yes gene_type:complete
MSSREEQFTPAASADAGSGLDDVGTSARQAPGEPVVTLTSVAADNTLLERVVEALKEVYDPEIPVNIYDLGLIYRVEIDNETRVAVDMTLTAPGCPVAQTFPMTVQKAVCGVAGVAEAVVELVWDPPWDQGRISDVARLQLGLL